MPVPHLTTLRLLQLYFAIATQLPTLVAVDGRPAAIIDACVKHGPRHEMPSFSSQLAAAAAAAVEVIVAIIAADQPGTCCLGALHQHDSDGCDAGRHQQYRQQQQINHEPRPSVTADAQSSTLPPSTANSCDLAEGRLNYLAFLLKLPYPWMI